MNDNRLWLVFVFFVVVSGVLCWRLFCLQIIEGSKWKAQAQGQQRLFTQTKGERGNIYIKSINSQFVPAAVNRNRYHAFISPRDLRTAGKFEEFNKEDFINRVKEILEIDKDIILEKIEKDNAYEVLKRNITEEELEKLSEIDGIHIDEETSRYYPEGELAAHVIGFVGGEGVGQYGVEQFYENVIGGKIGTREGIKNRWGALITKDSAKPGSDLHLTIDYNIQHFVERKLEEAQERFDVEGGTIIVGDPKTGEILALANFPTFDLNNYRQSNTDIFRNSAIQQTFEPGSIFKSITMAIALEEGVVNPNDTYNDLGFVRIHGRTLRNYGERSYGEVDMTEIIKYSINTGIVYVKDQIGNDTFVRYLEDFEFFTPTAIDLHGEVYSPNKNFFEGHDVNYATASFGQGIEMTSMQILKAFSVLANGGKLVQPHINSNFSEKKEDRRILSSEATDLITKMMIETVNDGFGHRAKIDGYYTAGKTGTAQVPWSKLGIRRSGYSDKTIQAFAGYAPAYDPEFVMIVKLDNPYTRSAEASAAPIFQEIGEYILNYKKIPHDYIIIE